MKISVYAILPGIIIGTLITMKTKPFSPPLWLMTVSGFGSFFMSIMWIQFSSNVIVALLQTFGFVTGLPDSLLALTIVAWGNCLGDMTADVAMTKRGYGEMAVTGTLAGPIFNILAGLGLGQTLSIISFAHK